MSDQKKKKKKSIRDLLKDKSSLKKSLLLQQVLKRHVDLF